MTKGILIEEYRGWEISFYPDEDCFCAYSDRFDFQSKERPSFSSVKKDIDEYIKANEKFKTIFVETTSRRLSNQAPIKIIGIRKDGRFVMESKNGKPEQMSSYDNKNYYVVDEENNPVYEELKVLQEKANQIKKQIEELENKLIKVTLEDLKSNYKGIYG